MAFKMNLENPFFEGIRKIIDMLMLNALWLLCCMPIVTIGAASSALYYTVHKTIRQERGYLFRSYFGAFKDNFKQSTLCWLIYMALFVFLYFDMCIMEQYLLDGQTIGLLYYVFWVFAGCILIWAIYLFGYIARFTDNLKTCLKNSALLAIANLPFSIILLVLAVVMYVLVMFVTPLLILALPVLVCCVYNVILERIFRKVMNEEERKNEIASDPTVKR